MLDRFDGRTAEQLRALSCQLGVLANADGSAQVQQGTTSVLAAVHGPKPAQQRSERFDRAVLEVKWKSRHRSDEEPWVRRAEHFMRSVLEPMLLLTAHPRSAISINLQVLFDDGSSLACGLHAAYLALVDAGIPLLHSCVSACCTRSRDGLLLMDGTSEEESARGAATACMVFTASADATEADVAVRCSEGPVGVVTDGLLTAEQLDMVVQQCKVACTQTACLLRHAVQHHVVPAD